MIRLCCIRHGYESQPLYQTLDDEAMLQLKRCGIRCCHPWPSHL